jgi:uncharacterized protein
MHYHIILTEKCNMQCKYCYEKSMKEFENGLEEKWKYDENAPFDSEINIESLNDFLEEGDTLIFYGGEPLIMLSKIKEIMKAFEKRDIRFCIQTNGMLLDNVPVTFLRRISKILISIDGDEKRNSYNKGTAHYGRIIKNIQTIRENGFTGEIVARMVIAPPYGYDIYEQVLHIVDLIRKGIFDSIHWQIDAGFYKNDFNPLEFSKFVEKYNESISKLVNWWIREMKDGDLFILYPFFGILNRLMVWDSETRLPCGAGHNNFTINTCGRISACPIMNSVENFYCGDLNTKPGKLKEIKIEDSTCKNCNYFEICGGRCLYWKNAKLWPKEGDDLICKTIMHLIDKIKEKIPKIEEIIAEGPFRKESFEYEKYFGPEIIP